MNTQQTQESVSFFFFRILGPFFLFSADYIFESEINNKSYQAIGSYDYSIRRSDMLYYHNTNHIHPLSLTEDWSFICTNMNSSQD